KRVGHRQLSILSESPLCESRGGFSLCGGLVGIILTSVIFFNHLLRLQRIDKIVHNQKFIIVSFSNEFLLLVDTY
ncbi:hypothetical protein, partial [Psychrobacter aquimaris]|uniref:hypothetical protein n=1 Tax=Psychrobacter aquimaris TaxID=292733 RepID=UPI001D113B7B